MLRLHQAAHVAGNIGARELSVIQSLVALDDPPAVGKKMRDDVGSVESGVLGLHVKYGALVLYVVVEPHLRPPERWPAHLGFEAQQVLA